jgi:hypothetical protein
MAFVMLPLGAFIVGFWVGLAIAAHDALDLCSRAIVCDLKQVAFIFSREAPRSKPVSHENHAAQLLKPLSAHAPCAS